MNKKAFAALIGAALAGQTQVAFSQQEFTDNVIRVGVMSDMSGAYADNCGPSSVEAARIAIEEFGGNIGGTPIEIITADDQNKPDIGVATAARWIDREGVDTIVTCSLTPIVLATSEAMAANKKPYMLAGSAATEATNGKCNPYTTNWAYDTYVAPRAVVEAMMAKGLDTWFFITVDLTYGKLLEEDAKRFVEAAGGKVVGFTRHPLNSTDFSGQLLEASASGAKVIAIANSGSDMANLVKQAQEYQVTQNGQVLAPVSMLLNGVHGIGVDAAQGLTFASLGYWDQNEETRELGKKFAERLNGRYPNEFQLATYSAVRHYLKAVSELGSDDGEAVMAKMRQTPVNDAFSTDVRIREDGIVARPMHIVTVKESAAVTQPWAYYDIQGVLSPEQVWRPQAESACAAFAD